MSNIHQTNVTKPAPMPPKPAREPVRLSSAELRQIVLDVMG